MAQTRRMARLRVRLKGYVDASTASAFEGYVAPGDHAVLEERLNHPGADTDYVRLDAPTLGAGDTWICTRWKAQRYAELIDVAVDAPARRSFADDPLAIDEKHLTDLVPAFAAFTYDLDRARYPWALPGIKVPLAPPRTNNCCTFVEALLVKGFSDARAGDFPWDANRHRQMMITSTDDYFSPVTAALKSGMAVPAPDADAPPHPWTLVQGWRHQWRGGHTFLVVDHHPATDKVLTLESNSGYRLDGVGFRGIGNLRDLQSRPPAKWWESPDVWTWQRVCSTYRYREQAWLRVKNRTWTAGA